MVHVLSSLRSRLIILVLLAVLPAFGVIIHSGFRQRQLAYEDAKSDLLRTLHFVSAREERMSEGAARWIEALAQHPDLDLTDLSRCPDFLNRILKESNFANLGVLDAQGNLVCSAIPFAGPLLTGNETYFRRALKAGQLFVSDYEIQSPAGIPAVVYSRVVTDANGDLSRIVFAQRSPEGFYDLIAHSQLPPDTTLTITDTKGTVITHYPDPERWMGQGLRDEQVLKTISTHEQGFAEATDIDGVERLQAFMPLTGRQPAGFVFASMSLESIHAKSNEILFKNLLALAGVSFLVLAAAAFWGYLLVIRNVNSLLDLAHRLGHGVLSARSGLGRGEGELSRLASAFDGMAESLQTREEQRRLTEESLQQSEENFRSLVENSPTGISIIQNDRVVYANPEYERLFQRPFVRNQSVDFSRIHPDDLEAVQAFYGGLTADRVEREDIRFRYQVAGERGENGEVKWLYCLATTMRYMGMEAILINMTDVTGMKEMERLLGIQDRMTSLGRVTAGIAHELRNPLSGINIHLSNLERVCESESLAEEERLLKATEIINQLKTASNRIEAVIRRVLDFSRPSEPKLVPVNLNHLISESIELCATTLRKGGIEIARSQAVDLPQCQADPSSLQQALMNLLTNAIGMLREWEGPKRLEVSSEVGANHLLIKVADSGPGIAAHLVDRVFEPFFSTQKGGLGIGLSICHRIVSDHGGTLTVGRSRWGGAEFTIALPKNGVHHVEINCS